MEETVNQASNNEIEISEESSQKTRKKQRGEEARWLLEEEYIFFEGQTLVGNKWTYLQKYLPKKSPKQMKNHFYSSIVKTARRIIKHKFEFSLKDIIISYYSLIYLKEFYNDKKCLNMIQFEEKSSMTTNITLKNLMLSKKLTMQKINDYMLEFMVKVNNVFKLMKEEQGECSTIRDKIGKVVKTRMIYQSLLLILNNQIQSDYSCKVILDFILNYLKR